MIRLTFTLRKPGQDHATSGRFAWSTFKVHGVLQCHEDRVVLEWAVTASTGEVDGMDVKMDVQELPVEVLELPLDRLYEVKVHTGWWRPHLTLTANDLRLLKGIPGADGSSLRLFIERADRPLAVHIAGDINDAIRRAQETAIPSPIPPA
jgi:hypothetical protein